MDWSDVARSALSAVFASATVIALFRFYFEKRIEHSFDRKLAEHEARLAELSGLRVAYGTERLGGYRDVVAQIRRGNRRCRDGLDGGANAADLLAHVARFEEMLYANAIALEHDGLYQDAHAWKNTMQSIAKRLENAARLDPVDPERAQSVRTAAVEQAPAAIA